MTTGRKSLGFVSFLFFSFFLPLCFTNTAFAGFTLVSPRAGETIVAKKPKVVFGSSLPLSRDELLVLLDGNDITALIDVNETIFSFSPYEPLMAGEHQLYLAGYDENGNPIEEEFYFNTRHSETFEELYTENEISAAFKLSSHSTSTSVSDINEDDSSTGFPKRTFDAYLTSDSTAREGNWNTSVRANVRMYDQDTALEEPEQKGVNLLDFLLHSDYAEGPLAVSAEIGDTTVEQSLNTIDYLTRRGGQASISYHNVTVAGFGVLGEESGYDIEGLGLGFDSNDHIMGTSAEVKLLDSKMAVKVIYAHGGEEGDSLGLWTESSGRKGDVAGIVLTSDFWESKLKSDFEFDSANYDYDTVDAEETVSDIAYRLKLYGNSGQSDYELSYNYTGPQYEVVGNNSVIKDWAGFDLKGGHIIDDHLLRLLLNYSWDNVEDDSFYGRIYSLTSGFDYQYGGWEQVPVSMQLEFNRQQSADEPTDSEETALDTSTLSGSVGYYLDIWSINAVSSYSLQNDTTLNDFDSRLFTFSIVPAVNYTLVSITPSWSYNSSSDLSTDVRTDTHTVTLDMYSSLWDDLISCELGGTYDWTKSDDDLTDLINGAAYARINYNVREFWGLEDSTIALEYTYSKTDDKVYDLQESETLVTLVLSTSIPYSF